MAKSEICITEDSIALLKDVSKGKPRRFVMLCKGQDVACLVLFKKGSVERHLTEARSLGSGQPCYGVVDGVGKNLSFKLARSEGFEKEPTRAAVLKRFLADHADLACTPTFEIVDVPPLVLDPDQPLVAQFLQLQRKAAEAAGARPDQATTFADLCQKVSVALNDEHLDAAALQLAQLEGLLRATASPPSSNLAAEFAERLRKVKPRLDASGATNPRTAEELKTLMSQVAAAAKNADFPKASFLLDQIESLLSAVPERTATSASNDSGEAQAAQLTEALKQLRPQLDQLLLTDPSRRNELVSLMTQAAVSVKAKRYDEAATAIEDLRARLQARSQSRVSSNISVMQLGKARIEWQQVRSNAIDGIRRLQVELKRVFKDDLDQRKQLAEALTRLSALIEQLNDELGEQLDRVLNAEESERLRLAAVARSTLTRFIKFVDQDELMVSLDENEVIPSMWVVDPLRASLANIDKVLG
ncbi:MAG: hypothetical protein U0939_27075 [Pirellulales bacterium]